MRRNLAICLKACVDCIAWYGFILRVLIIELLKNGQDENIPQRWKHKQKQCADRETVEAETEKELWSPGDLMNTEV